MGAFDRVSDRFRRWVADRDLAVAKPAVTVDPPVDAVEEARLWARLREDPNDARDFALLADVVRRRASEHAEGDRQTAADDAVWALSEELAHSPRAWYPLIELARLSVHDDREASLRRLATAAERDPSGAALATGLAMLIDAGMPGDALNLGVGHWRPREHDPAAGEHLVEAAIAAGRHGEARRHLDALALHPDTPRVQALLTRLDRRITASEQGRPLARPPVVDVREVDLTKPEPPPRRKGFLRR
jgi:hypothetical protein